MAAKAKAAPKKAAVKASKSKAKTKYSKVQQQAYTTASRKAVVKARALQNVLGVQHRRALAAARSKAKPGRSGKRLKPVSGGQAVIRNKVLAGQAAAYARRTQTYSYQQAAFISGLATAIANKKAFSKVLARKKVKTVAKKSSAPKRKPSPFAAIGAKAGAAAAASVPSTAKPAKPSKPRKAAGITPAVNSKWITGGNDKGVENCVAVAIANHLLLHTGRRVTRPELIYLSYRDSVWKAISWLDYHESWKGIGLSEYGMVEPEDAEPGDIVGFETSKGSHCGVLMPGNMVISWGEIVPLESKIDEAWQVKWTVTSQ